MPHILLSIVIDELYAKKKKKKKRLACLFDKGNSFRKFFQALKRQIVNTSQDQLVLLFFGLTSLKILI